MSQLCVSMLIDTADQGICNGRASICLSHQSTAGVVYGMFAAECP